MLETLSSPSYLAYQEGKAVLEALANVGRPPHPSIDPVIPTAAEQLGVRTDIEIPHWSEHTLRDLIESLPDALVVIGSHGAIVLVNAQTERIFGYQQNELLGRPIEILVPQHLRAGHVGKRDHYFSQPKTRAMGEQRDLFGRRKDGTEFPVEISLSPLRTEHGVFASSAIRDISQRKREEAKFRTLVENIPAVTFIAPLDERAPELYVSPEIERLLGFSQKEWLEDPVLWHRQLHPEDRERWNRQFAPTCASGKPFEEIYRFIAKNGDVVWVHGSASMVRDADGTPSFLQGVAFDITKIKNAEEALHRAKELLRQNNVELDRRVQERTEELTRSLAELRDKSDELRLFAYQASHDLQKPLISLVNWPERLAKVYGGKGDEQFDEWINRTINGAKRMRRLIKEGIEPYSKYLQNNDELPAVDCNAAVHDACSSLQGDVESSGATIEIVGALPTVTGTPFRLTLLFQNLIGNAIKYREPERALRVEIGARRRRDGWHFWVRDNGIGFEPKYNKRIFKLGERLHNETKIPGTGFGLYICERIVAARGGRMRVRSRLGEGTTFFFTWPSAQDDRMTR